VVAVRVVENAPDGEVHMVPVRDGGVPAALAVVVRALDRRADAGPGSIHVEGVLVGVPFVRRVEVPVVQVVGVVAVLDGAVSAIRTVRVSVIAVRGARHPSHGPPAFEERQAASDAKCAEWRSR